MAPLKIELIKSAITLISSLIILGTGWIIGLRITYYWNIQQKIREQDITISYDFHKLYGEFFAIWKLWSYSLDNVESAPEERNRLLERACTAEGLVESMIVRLASVRHLSNDEVETLGKFRQAYQSLRQSIRDKKNLGWSSHKNPQYIAFKELSIQVSALIRYNTSLQKEEMTSRINAFKDITSNKWESKWHSKEPSV